MDHVTIREQLELAAVEPGGLERLMAGDTATAQAVAAHLAGCAACAEELARLERASSVIRTVVREHPPADLRDRVLATVRAAGVARGTVAASSPSESPSPSSSVEGSVAHLPAARREPASRGSTLAGRQAVGWVAAIAAAVVLSVISTSLIVGARVDEQLAARAETVEALEQVAIATLHVTSEPDARRVALAGATGLSGDLVYSPSTSELVVVATGLTEPPSGQEYRCWVELGGVRQRVGKMFFSDDLAYWVGPAPAVAGVLGDATFGVSLADVNGSAVDADPVLDGRL